jgi:hypothetical protein
MFFFTLQFRCISPYLFSIILLLFLHVLLFHSVRYAVTRGTIYFEARSKFYFGDCNVIYSVSLPKKLDSLYTSDFVVV